MICGFLGSITYTLAVFVPLPFRIDYLIFFIVGPFIIAGMYAIFQYLRTGRDSIALQLGTLFMVCAGIAITMMATMQGFIRGHYREARAGVEKEEEIDAVRQIFLAVDSTQQGLDMAFDVFVSTGTFLFALALVRQPRYGAWYGIPGMAVGALGLFLNALSFPIVNAGEAGYIDAAPFFGTFYGVLSVKFLWEWIQVERGKLQLPAQEPSHL
jgi:hypothetical protein